MLQGQHPTTALLPPAEGPTDSVTVRQASRLAAASARDPAFFRLVLVWHVPSVFYLEPVFIFQVSFL